MDPLNRPDNFLGRVAFAVSMIANNREDCRDLDSCFENSDGPAVAAALIRQAETNPRLRRNLPNYLRLQDAEKCAERFRGQDLADVARTLWAQREWVDELAREKDLITLFARARVEDQNAFRARYANADNPDFEIARALRATIFAQKSEADLSNKSKNQMRLAV